MTDVAIVILNYKMRTLFEECLKSLFVDIATTKLAIKIVVVDNGSDDGLLEWVAAEYPQVITIQMGGNVGFGKANNAGIRAVEAKYYFILNPDTRFIQPETVQRLYEWMESHPKVGVAGPLLLNGDGSLQYTCNEFPSLTVQLVRRSPLSQYSFFKKRIDKFLMKGIDRTQARPVDWIQGSAMFVRKAALDVVGGLDERFWMYYEDTDWCRRFWQAGWPVYYIAPVKLIHYHGRGSAAVPGIFKPLVKNKLAREHLKSWARYFWKWRGAPTNTL